MAMGPWTDSTYVWERQHFGEIRKSSSESLTLWFKHFLCDYSPCYSSTTIFCRRAQNSVFWGKPEW